MILNYASIFGGVLRFLAAVISGAVNWMGSQPSPDERFQIVDRYNNRCDVIQYSPTNAARYTYFLDCKK